MKSMTLILFTCLALQVTVAQNRYFPERNVKWEEKLPKDVKIDSNKLEQAVSYAKDNEYSEPQDLRIAILKGFEREPYHEILGPTKKEANRQV